MAREASKAVKLAQDLPKFGQVITQKRGSVPVLGGNITSLNITWDLNADAKESQVFYLSADVDYKGKQVPLRAYVSKQALEHYLRAV